MNEIVNYSVLISKKDDPDGITGIDLEVPDDFLPVLIDMVLSNGHKIEINDILDVSVQD